MHALRALSGDARLLRALHGGRVHGRVHSAFARAANVLDAGGAIWTLACRSVGDGPGALVVDVHGLEPFGLSPGDVVRTRRGALAIGTRVVVALEGARAWSCVLPRWPDATQEVARNLEGLDQALRRHAVATAGERPALAANADALLAGHTARLEDALAAGDGDAARAHATAMIGLGPGLTPSGDDRLVGLLVALGIPAGPCPALRGIASHIVSQARGRTNALGVAMLEAAADGRVREPVVALLRALLHGDRESVSCALAPVLAIGSTSGADIARGIVCGLGAHLRAEARRADVDGAVARVPA